jgi:hypothetical protein
VACEVVGCGIHKEMFFQVQIGTKKTIEMKFQPNQMFFQVQVGCKKVLKSSFNPIK